MMIQKDQQRPKTAKKKTKQKSIEIKRNNL